MMPSQNARFEVRGLHCPSCGSDLRHRLVAKSYPSPGGIYRLRICPKCHRDIETLEAVVGFDAEVMDVSDLSKDDILTIRRLVTDLRRRNAHIWSLADERRRNADLLAEIEQRRRQERNAGTPSA